MTRSVRSAAGAQRAAKNKSSDGRTLLVFMWIGVSLVFNHGNVVMHRSRLSERASSAQFDSGSGTPVFRPGLCLAHLYSRLTGTGAGFKKINDEQPERWRESQSRSVRQFSHLNELPSAADVASVDFGD